MRHTTCRSEPARDSGGSASMFFECATAIASRLTPTRFVVWLVWGIFALLSGCATQAPLPAGNPTLPLPLQLHIERQQAEQRQDWLLVIQREGAGVRWSTRDPLELSAALLFALTPSGELLRNYPAAQQQGEQRSLPARWDIRYSQPLSFELKLPQGPHYRVSPLGEPTP